MLVSLIAAVLAALCYGVASVMQAVAVREASNRSRAQASAGGLDAGLVPRMLHQWRFVASMVIDLLGFIAQLVALQRLPLFAVQAMVAANLAVIAVLASVVIGATLSAAGMARGHRRGGRRRTARLVRRGGGGDHRGRRLQDRADRRHRRARGGRDDRRAGAARPGAHPGARQR